MTVITKIVTVTLGEEVVEALVIWAVEVTAGTQEEEEGAALQRVLVEGGREL